MLAFISLAALVPASAYTVSFVVAETGLPEEQGVSEYSNFWESGLLDVFFDAGHIVSNAPVLRLAATPSKQLPDEAAGTLSEADASGAEYFVLALLDYQEISASSASPAPRPKQVSIRLFKMNPFRFVREEKFAGSANTRFGDDFISAKRAGMKILPYLE
ncbi:MAG: hypothetical protein LBH15_08625 [Treponema sp.]|jgi:hypothetical protein|nr:hypothetical protein [Treponema sp.]